MSCTVGHRPLTHLDFLARLPTLPRRDVHEKFHAGRFQLTEMGKKEVPIQPFGVLDTSLSAEHTDGS